MVSINGVDTSGMSHATASRLLENAGQTLTIDVIRYGGMFQFRFCFGFGFVLFSFCGYTLSKIHKLWDMGQVHTRICEIGLLGDKV